MWLTKVHQDGEGLIFWCLILLTGGVTIKLKQGKPFGNYIPMDYYFQFDILIVGIESVLVEVLSLIIYLKICFRLLHFGLTNRLLLMVNWRSLYLIEMSLKGAR